MAREERITTEISPGDVTEACDAANSWAASLRLRAVKVRTADPVEARRLLAAADRIDVAAQRLVMATTRLGKPQPQEEE